jgi:hypothetical protein
MGSAYHLLVWLLAVLACFGGLRRCHHVYRCPILGMRFRDAMFGRVLQLALKAFCGLLHSNYAMNPLLLSWTLISSH